MSEPDIILHRGLFTTLDPTNPTASAVAIKDGVFAAVGHDREIMALAGPKRLKGDAGLGRKRKERRHIFQRNARVQRLEGEGAVHGPGFEIQQPKIAGEMAGDGALTRARRPIDSDDGPAGFG